MIVAEAKQKEKTRQFWPIGDRLEKAELIKNKTLSYWLQGHRSKVKTSKCLNLSVI